MEKNAPLVHHIVRRLAGRFPSSYSEDDLVQTGMLGLIEATKRYDSNRGVAFSTFAGRRIEGAVYDLLRREDWLPRNRRTLDRRIGQAEVEIAASGDGVVTDAAIGALLGLTAEQISANRKHAWRARIDSLDRLAHDGESSTTVGEGVECNRSAPDADLDYAELLGFLRDGVSLLPERHRMVVVAIFFESRSVTDVGIMLGVSQSRASQLKSEAIEMLRLGLEQQYAESEVEDTSSGRQKKFNESLATHTDWRERVNLIAV